MSDGTNVVAVSLTKTERPAPNIVPMLFLVVRTPTMRSLDGVMVAS